MKFNKLESFETKKEFMTRAGDFTVGKALTNMDFYAHRIIKSYEYYKSHDPEEYTTTTAWSDIIVYQDRYVQAFIDIASVLLSEHSTSLESLILGYIKTYDDLSDNAHKWLVFWKRHNALIHEYYNAEVLQVEFENVLRDYSDGILDLCVHLCIKCNEANIFDVTIRKEHSR